MSKTVTKTQSAAAIGYDLISITYTSHLQRLIDSGEEALHARRKAVIFAASQWNVSERTVYRAIKG